MELEWERERPAARAGFALLGAFLGSALGADGFLAAEQWLGGAPAVLCGAVMALFAIRGGALFAGREDRVEDLLALPPLAFWGVLANHLSFVLDDFSGGPAAAWRAFCSLETLSARYWMRLAGLLWMAFVAWVLLFLQAEKIRNFEKRAAGPCRNRPQPPPADLEIFLPKRAWIRPFLLERRIGRGLWLALFFLCVWMRALTGHPRVWDCALAGMLASILFILSLQGPPGRICAALPVLYARKEGRLWAVNMNGIRYADLMIPLSRLAGIWDRLPAERRTSFLNCVAAAISSEERNVVFIKDPKLKRQSKWEWEISGAMDARLVIPKVYPGFSPVPGGAERAQEPPPLRWINPLCGLVMTVICFAAGCGIGLREEYQANIPDPPLEESFQPDESILDNTEKARVPEEIGSYTMNGLVLQTDSRFETTADEIVNPESGVRYQISLQYGVGDEAALSALEKPSGESRYLRERGEDFLWRMGDNGVIYRYNLRTAYLDDGRTLHTGAALSERGTLLIIRAAHGPNTEEDAAREDLLYMLENLQFTGPAITEENYQDQLRPAVGMGFTYCGQAFFKAPLEMFGYDAYLITFLPCGGEVHYYDDGLSVMTEVHGLRVSAAAVFCDGTAMDVVDRAYQALKEAGRRYDEGSVFEDAYNEEANTACRAAVYYDGNRTRPTVLCAVEEGGGWYIFKELTCLPEKIDGEYSALFREMETATGLSVPYMETLGQFGRSGP